MRVLFGTTIIALALAGCEELGIDEPPRPEQGQVSGPAVFNAPASQSLVFSSLAPSRLTGFRIDSEITQGQSQVYQIVLTLPPEFVFNGFDSLGPEGTRIGAYGFEFNPGSDGPDRLFPVYSTDQNNAWVDSNLDGNTNPLKPQIAHSYDGQQNNIITITLPRGGDGSTSASTAPFSSEIMASLRTGIFTNPSTPGQYQATLNFISVDPDSGDANDNAGSPPETFEIQTSIGIGQTGLSASVLPNSRSVPFGNSATAFATMANGSNSAMTNCRILLLTVVKGGFAYQTTDPNTNALTGAINSPVTIPASSSQSFVIAFNPVQEFYNSAVPFTAEPLEFAFVCDEAQAALIPGVNTLRMNSGTQAQPDVIAIAATTSGDGVLYLPSVNGRGAVGVAGMNIGAAGEIVITPRSGLAGAAPLSSLEGPLAISPPALALTICETTNQPGGSCSQPATQSLTVNFAANEVRTFSIFVQGQGESIANDPAVNRVFLDFTQANDARGGTSVAVTTASPPG